MDTNNKFSDLRKTTRDKCTLSDPTTLRPASLALDWVIDFSAKTISGSVTYSLKTLAPTDTVRLDARDLNVKKVTLNEKELQFALGESHKAYGEGLSITLPRVMQPAESFTITIEYATSVDSSALCWMTAEQTDSGTLPFLFSQCQAIHARSMVPCFDFPGVRCPYSATVTAPSEFVVVMSGLLKDTQTSADGRFKTYKFDQPKAMASYLIAIAVGNLTRVEFGPRCAVHCDPTSKAQVEFEFTEIEKFLSDAESIVGPYEWGRYDVLVLPMSFPYGGMENPCLTFVSPTIIAGDKSMVYVVAHEIAHSWTGNLVGIETWEDFWLNESFTTMLERKIMAKDTSQQHFDMNAILGWKDLKDDVERYGLEHPYTVLRPDLEGADPDDSFSTVPYEKGFNLLCDIQRRVGNKRFDEWLWDYVQTFREKCVNTTMVLQHMQEKMGEEALKGVDVVQWMDKPGMPPLEPGFDSSMLDVVHATAKRWIDGGLTNATATDIEGWCHEQKVVLLNTLCESSAANSTPYTAAALEAVDRQFNFTNGPDNADILLPWLTMCIQAQCGFIDERLVSFTRIGRMKYIRPFYRCLYSVNPQRARELFKSKKSKYHNIAQKMIAKDLELE